MLTLELTLELTLDLRLKLALETIYIDLDQAVPVSVNLRGVFDPPHAKE